MGEGIRGGEERKGAEKNVYLNKTIFKKEKVHVL